MSGLHREYLETVANRDTPVARSYWDWLEAQVEQGRQELVNVKIEMGKAASLINCAGSLSHRITIMLTEHGEQIQAYEKRIAELEAENKKLIKRIDGILGAFYALPENISAPGQEVEGE